MYEFEIHSTITLSHNAEIENCKKFIKTVFNF